MKVKINLFRPALRAIGIFAALLCVPRTLSAANLIQNGSTVTIHYTLTVENKVVDSSVGKTPLVYVQGSGQIIPGLEEKLAGAKPGDKKRVTVPPEKGYGPVNPDAFQNVPKKSFHNYKNLKVGSLVTGNLGGRPVHATVMMMDDKNVVLDLNHPLAGKTLQFDVQVVDVKSIR